MVKLDFDDFIGSEDEKKIIEKGFNNQLSGDAEKKLFLDTIKKQITQKKDYSLFFLASRLALASAAFAALSSAFCLRSA